MAILRLCDICQSIIKKGAKKYILGANEVIENGENGEVIEDFTEFIQRYKQGLKQVQIYEICQECRNILEYLFRMRDKERQKILKEITKLYEKKEKK